MQPKRTTAWQSNLQQHAVIVGGFVATLWLLEAFDQLLGHGGLDAYGIRPRTLSGLLHIPLAPFLHAGFPHLIANTMPLIVLCWLTLLRGVRDFVVVTLTATLVSGLGIWLFGASNSIHIGASGLIFGYFGYLVARAYFERSLAALALAAVALILYGGILTGTLPTRADISWLGHLFGFFGGILAAYWLAGGRRSSHTSSRGSPPNRLTPPA